MKEYKRKRVCQESGGGDGGSGGEGGGRSPAAPPWCDVTESFSPCFLTKEPESRPVLLACQVTCRIRGSANPNP